MISYILIETALFTAQMRNELKGFNSRNGFYLIDSDDTLEEVKLLSDNSPRKSYYILTWEQDRPTSVLPRYKTTEDGGDNYKTNWIMTPSEFRDNVKPDIEPNVNEPI